jgi:hypothetical protein
LIEEKQKVLKGGVKLVLHCILMEAIEGGERHAARENDREGAVVVALPRREEGDGADTRAPLVNGWERDRRWSRPLLGRAGPRGRREGPVVQAELGRDKAGGLTAQTGQGKKEVGWAKNERERERKGFWF